MESPPIQENNVPTGEGNQKDSILINTIEKLSDSKVYLFVFTLIVIFTIISFIILFSGVNKNNVTVSAIDRFFRGFNVKTFTVVMLSILITFIVGIILLLYTKTFKTVFQVIDKLGWSFALMLFIIGLVIFYYYIKPDVLEQYSIIFLGVICLLAFKFFYNALQQTEEETYRPNLQIEKIRFSLAYFAFLCFVFIMYFNDIGGIVSNFLGPSVIFTFVLLAIGLVYLLNLLSFPLVKQPTDSTKSIFASFTWFGIFHTLLFIGTVATFAIGVVTNYKHFSDDDGKLSFKNSNLATLSVLFGFIMSLWLVFYLVRTAKNPKDTLTGSESSKLNSVSNIAQQAINLILGFTLIGVLIAWGFDLAQNYESDNKIIPLLLNIGLILVIVYFAYKYLANSTQFQKSPYYRLVVNLIFYIPCLLYNIVEWIFAKFGITIPTLDELISGAKSTNIGTRKDLIILVGIIFLNALYFVIAPYAINKVAKQGGNVVVLQPVPLSQPAMLGSYMKLNGIDPEDGKKPVSQQAGIINYTYAISFWVYFNSNEGTNKNTFYTVLNFGEMPHIKWNPKRGELSVTLKSKPGTTEENIFYPETLDDAKDTIIYKSNEFKAQRWNNIVVNYTNGTFDFFINSKLVKSKNDVVPVIEQSALNIGSPELNGSICNLIYFNFSLTLTKIHYLYNLVKNNDPPIPLNTSFGSTEKAIYDAVGHKNNEKTVIPINIETDIFNAKQVIDRVDQVADTINPLPRSDFLSLHWYFKQNKDGNNSIHSGGAEDTCKYPQGDPDSTPSPFGGLANTDKNNKLSLTKKS
uniref:Uncharacterized protein n=1 Tax=viral metagenome TaxID=1070528 RepID=A0A6C0FBT3_9ZZZZ|tara:strand:+ start:8197 stop:10602 length:2406 start_codon:yes stop_codon:yes gene_type:complete